MYSFDPKTERLAEDFKTHCLQIATELHITQQQIANSTGYNQGTISRWFSASELHSVIEAAQRAKMEVEKM